MRRCGGGVALQRTTASLTHHFATTSWPSHDDKDRTFRKQQIKCVVVSDVIALQCLLSDMLTLFSGWCVVPGTICMSDAYKVERNTLGGWYIPPRQLEQHVCGNVHDTSSRKLRIHPTGRLCLSTNNTKHTLKHENRQVVAIPTPLCHSKIHGNN